LSAKKNAGEMACWYVLVRMSFSEGLTLSQTLTICIVNKLFAIINKLLL
jgi:hypothetical protein